jgi:hypothetical protein
VGVPHKSGFVLDGIRKLCAHERALYDGPKSVQNG